MTTPVTYLSWSQMSQSFSNNGFGVTCLVRLIQCPPPFDSTMQFLDFILMCTEIFYDFIMRLNVEKGIKEKCVTKQQD